MLQSSAKILLSTFGWRTVTEQEPPDKFLVLGAPHTSNWDFPIALLAFKAMGLRFSWVGKHTLFSGPAGPIMRKLGGIPVNRRVRGGFLEAMVNAFESNDQLVLGIAPEGTRSKKDHWKAGFYHIAAKARVHVCLGFVDYPSKTVGTGPFFLPSGDVAADFEQIKSFYRDKRGKTPANQNDVELREKEICLLNKLFKQSKNNL